MDDLTLLRVKLLRFFVALLAVGALINCAISPNPWVASNLVTAGVSLWLLPMALWWSPRSRSRYWKKPKARK